MAERKRRPIRGGIAGLVLGLGAALMIMLYDLAIPGDLVIVGFVVLGVLIGLFAPVRGARGAPAP